MGSWGAFNETIAGLEREAAAGPGELASFVERAITVVEALLKEALAAEERPWQEDDRILELWKRLVKGQPELNAIRDNCRELVYYRNCLAENRLDALPKNPAAMAAHTVRHLFLYLKSRAEQQT